MTTVALVAAKGAPGVTTTTLLLAAVWPTPCVLLEADTAGGDLRTWFTCPDGPPLRADSGVVSLLAAHHRSGVLADRDLFAHSETLPGGLPVLLGPASPAQAEALRGQWSQLPEAAADHQGDVLIDAGRITGAPGEQLHLLRATALVLVVCRATVTSLTHTRDLLHRLSSAGLEPQVLLVGSMSAREDISRALAQPVQRLPHDPLAAAALAAGAWSRKLDRSPLLAAARRLAATVHEQLHTPPVTPVPPVATATSTGNRQDPAADLPHPVEVTAR